jgi:RNA polymerase sigma-70 factor (ECF subfamily)
MKWPATLSAADQEDGREMAQLAAGHDAALNNLMARHAEKLFHFLTRALQNEEDAEDLAQETFARVYHNRANFDPRQKFTTWLYAIASNLARDRYRWRKRHPQVSLDAENQETGASLGERLVDSSALPGDHLQSLERAEAVRRAVGALPPELGAPLLLAEYEGRTHGEIGEILGCTAKAVEMRVHRARQQLRTALAALIQEL